MKKLKLDLESLEVEAFDTLLSGWSVTSVSITLGPRAPASPP